MHTREKTMKISHGKLVGNIAALVAMIVMLVAPAGAQTWQLLGKSATIPVVVENTACNSSTDTVGINAERTLLLICQSGKWIVQGLGYGQTWQHMMGSAVGCAGVRAVNVVCTNTTGKPISVLISAYNPGSAFTGWINVNGVGMGVVNGAANYVVTVSAIVPNGQTYSLGYGAGTLYGWHELR